MNYFLHCQVCGLKKVEPLNSTAPLEWCAHSIDFSQGELMIVTCPKCAQLDIGEIFEGYQNRIKNGQDARFH